MKCTYIIAAGLVALLAVGLLLWVVADRSEPSLPVEVPRQMSSPATQHVTGITDEELAAQLDQVRRQLGPDFRVQIVKPFVVAGDISAKDLDGICQRTIGWAVEMLNKDFFSTPLKQVITIYLFRDQQSYHRYSQSLFGQKPTTPYGYYLPQHRALVMNIATGTGTLVHEMVHPLLAVDFPQVPSWFDEGLASLYEQCRQRDGNIIGLLNWRLPVFQEGLRAGHFVPLEELLASSRQEFYDDLHGMHYAQARYLCYYLQEKNQLRQFYQQFKKDCSNDPSGAATLLRVTGESSLQQLQTEWLEFLAPLRFEP